MLKHIEMLNIWVINFVKPYKNKSLAAFVNALQFLTILPVAIFALLRFRASPRKINYYIAYPKCSHTDTTCATFK